MADDAADRAVEKRIVTDTLTYGPIVEALKDAGFKAKLDEDRSFKNGDGCVAIYFEPMSRADRNRLVETLVGTGLYLDKDQGLAKSFPSAVRSHFDNDLYHDKDVKGLIRIYADPLRDDNFKQTGDYKVRLELGGLDLSFSPDLDPNGKGLTYESAQKLANAVRKQAGKQELPIQKAPEKLPTLAELEKSIPDFKEAPRPADPAKLVKAVNRQFGPHGYTFEQDEKGSIVSTKPLEAKDKDLFMGVLAGMPDEARLLVAARYLNPDAPRNQQQFRLTVNPTTVTEKQLSEFAGFSPDKLDALFEQEQKSNPGDPKSQSQLHPSVQEAARAAVAFQATESESAYLSVPKGPQKDNYRA